ncbi:MAG TPA: PEGA domain-containing protein, partial [Polyangiaceae bacterium]
LIEDPAALTSSGGTLVLEISETDPVVFVDGKSRGVYAAPLRLPPGRHALRIERGEFLPVERDISILANQTTTVSIALEPTAEKRAAYNSSARSQRLWGWVATGAGSALILGGGAFLVINQGREDDQRTEIDEISRREECDGQSNQYDPACTEEHNAAIEDLDSILAQNSYGWIGAGVGAAAVITGVVLLVTSDDPDRYEPKPESDVFARVIPNAWLGNQSVGIGAVGSF